MNSVDEALFATSGYAALRGFHSKAALAGLRRRISDEVAHLAANASAWKSLRKLPAFQQVTRLSSLVRIPGLHQTLAIEELHSLVADLAGRPVPMTQDAQLLLSPPNQGAWKLDSLNWHVDVTSRQQDHVPGVQVFFLLDDVAPHGGATLALAGSHLHRPSAGRAASDLREVLRTSTDLKRDLQGLDVEIIEMSGRAGDVFLMDMRVLHTPSVNSSKNWRMMATCRFLSPHQPGEA